MSGTVTGCPTVSVIMPVYNTGEVLRDTIHRVLTQSWDDFELLLIDDGSTDGSSSVCDEFQEADARVRVFHKDNGGICAARNFGLMKARGKYVGFCDHDDVMMPNCLEKCVEALQKSDADMVRFRRRCELYVGNRVRRDELNEFPEQTVNHMDWQNFLLVERLTGYGVWAGLYRREMLESNDIKFNEEVRYGFEDHIFVTECCAAVKNVVLIPDLLYVWVRREHFSTSMRKDADAFSNRMDSIRLWAKADATAALHFRASSEEYQGRAFVFLWFAMHEIDRTDMTYRQKKHGYEDLQRGLESDIRGVNPDVMPYAMQKPSGQPRSLKDCIKNWCIEHGAMRAYHVLEKIKRLID